jgi:hypothetical protein
MPRSDKGKPGSPGGQFPGGLLDKGKAMAMQGKVGGKNGKQGPPAVGSFGKSPTKGGQYAGGLLDKGKAMGMQGKGGKGAYWEEAQYAGTEHFAGKGKMDHYGGKGSSDAKGRSVRS